MASSGQCGEQNKVMLDISKVRPGQRITVKYSSPVTWARKTDNPYMDLAVERQLTVAFTAAGAETYANKANALGHETSGKTSWHCPAPEVGPCIRKHASKGGVYLAGINHDTIMAQFTIGGAPVSHAEELAIRSFLRASEERERGLDFRLWTVDKLANAFVSDQRELVGE